MKPMLNYRGGKWKELPRIVPHIPRFAGRYVEPFLGGRARFFFLEPPQALLYDINPKLMAFYRGVRDHFPTLHRELDTLERLYMENRRDFARAKAQTPHAQVEDKNEFLYYQLRTLYHGGQLPTLHYSEAALYYFINKTAYSGMIRHNAQGEFNVPYGRYRNLNTAQVSYAHSCLLHRATLCQRHLRAVPA